jgi:hypothetical protein
MITNNIVTDSYVYYTILFITILECTPTYKKIYCKTLCCVTLAAASDILCLPCLLIASFSLVLDLILCCFVYPGPSSNGLYHIT